MVTASSNHTSFNSHKEGDRNASGNGKHHSSRPSSSSSSSTHKVKREYTEEDGSPQQRKANKDRQQGNSKSSKSSSKPRSDGVKKEIDMEKVKKEGGSAKREDETIEKRKPGQKNATPTPGQADRVFYETLLKQKPESHMAQDWCLAYGVLGEEESRELYKLVCKRKGLQPTKNAPPLTTSPTKKAKKSSSGGSRPRSSLPKEMDADTGFEPTGMFEGVGTTGL